MTDFSIIIITIVTRNPEVCSPSTEAALAHRRPNGQARLHVVFAPSQGLKVRSGLPDVPVGLSAWTPLRPHLFSGPAPAPVLLPQASPTLTCKKHTH